MIFPDKFVKANTATIAGQTETEVTKYGLHTDVAKRGSPHKWNVEFKTSLFNEENIRELGAFLDTLDGQYETFTMKSPVRYMGDVAGLTAAVAASPNPYAGSNSIDVNGLVASGVKYKAGDFFKFSNHDKVYKITESTASDGAGYATLNFHPRLKADTLSSNGVTIEEAVFTLRLKADKNALALSAKTLHHSLLISAIEA